MVYIKGLNIKTFRGIKNLDIQDFSDINIITGNNNCGKTSLLEIIQGMSFPIDTGNWVYAIGKREGFANNLSLYEAINDIFDINSEEKKVEFVVCSEKGASFNLQITAEKQTEIMTNKEINKLKFSKSFIQHSLFYDDDKENDQNVEVNGLHLSFEATSSKGKVYAHEDVIYDFSRKYSPKSNDSLNATTSTYIAPFQHTSNSLYLKDVLQDSDMYSEMLDILRKFDSDIISINSFSENNSTVFTLTSKTNKKALPLDVYGDGMKKALLLMSAIIKAKDGILLLDEFETAIHTSVMNDVFSWILKSAKKMNVQLFMTTHSEEAIKKILTCDEDELDNMRVITLYKKEDNTVARVFSGRKALDVKNDFGLELR